METAQKRSYREKKIRNKICDLFDFGEMAERTLGKHCKNLTFKQQVEFRNLFQEFLEELYVNRIQGHADENIIYLGENIATNLLATVKTKMVTKISEICVDCKMIMKNQGWKIKVGRLRLST
jgi:phospholipid transport system substrate-binding protein